MNRDGVKVARMAESVCIRPIMWNLFNSESQNDAAHFPCNPKPLSRNPEPNRPKHLVPSSLLWSFFYYCCYYYRYYYWWLTVRFILFTSLFFRPPHFGRLRFVGVTNKMEGARTLDIGSFFFFFFFSQVIFLLESFQFNSKNGAGEKSDSCFFLLFDSDTFCFVSVSGTTKELWRGELV